MASIVNLVERIDRLSLDTAKGVVRLDVVGMCGNEICIQALGPKSLLDSEAVGCLIEAVPGFPSKSLAFTRSDESVSVAWFAVK